MPAKTKTTKAPKPLDPPATEAELEEASRIWTASMDDMTARGWAPHLFGNQSRGARELTILLIREARATSTERHHA